MANIIRIGCGGVRAVPHFFGDGADGAFVASADTVWNAPAEDTGMIVKQFTSLTIPAGVTVSAGNRNCGMVIRVRGDCTIAGTMRNRMSPKTLLSTDNVDFSAWPLSMLEGEAGNGGAGGTGGGLLNPGTGGAGMVGRFYGGGWSGGGGGASDQTNTDGHHGGAGGAAAAITTQTANLFDGGDGGGAEGANGGGGGGYYVSGGTGAGISGGNSTQLQAAGGGGGAGNIGGGVIILLVGGNLTISGTVDCGGNPGGNGGSGGGAGGGGAGGGRIFVCHKGNISNTGELTVSGGSAGTAGTGGSPATAAVAGTGGTTAVKTWDEYKAEDIGTDGRGTPVISVTSLPENPDPHTIYLIRVGGDDT